MQLEILNYEQFNPRGDSKKPSWFRFENTFFFSQSMFDLSKDERIVWIFILCFASQKNTGIIDIEVGYICHHTQVQESSVFLAIEKLQAKRCLTITRTEVARHSHESLRDSPATYVRTDERYEQTTVSTVLEKSKPGPVEFKTYQELVDKLPPATKTRWSELYQDPVFIKREIIKAFGYYDNNPRKKPKTIRGWCAALSSWLERSWPRHVKSIKPNAANYGGVVKD